MLLQRADKSVWQVSIRFLRNNNNWTPRLEPETFENVVFPPNGEYKLPAMPVEPTYDTAIGEQKFKSSKQLVSIRGVEEIHTELIHKQYGLAAVAGGFISSYDFNFIRDRLNRNLLKNQFAIWRVPAPWLPRTKKATGAKAGSGKGNIHHYVTPVRAKRIILEVGGHIMELEARAYLMYLCERFRFPVEFVSEKILEEKKYHERRIEEINVNKFNWNLVLKYNMQDCHKWLSYYDVAFNNGYEMALGADEELLYFSFRNFVLVTAGLPLLALFLCISLALTLHLDETTRTHCGVVNYLPSISAAVSSFPPERYIWRFFIALHSAPRIVEALAFKNLLLSSPLRPLSGHIWFELACYAGSFVNIVESLFLLLLTTVSSTENHVLHKLLFGGFAVCSTIYMFIATSMFHYSGRRRTSSLGEKSFQYKVLMCSTSTLSLMLAVYFFNRHNTYCEPGIYTLFAVAEYAVVDVCDESGSLKVRRSNREIRKPKFDDEIVDSISTAKIVQRKRPSVERMHHSPEAVDHFAEKTQMTARVKLGKKQYRTSESSVGTPVDVKGFKKFPGKPICQVQFGIVPDKKRRERSGSKEARTKELASLTSHTTSLGTSGTGLTESLKKWTALDDVALITAVTRVSSIAAVHGAVRFSRSFSRAELEERWCELLYDETASNIAKRRIADLSMETISAVQSRTVFTVKEDELLSAIPSTTSGSDLAVFEQVLGRHKEAFHHARTASVLQQHWLEMKNWDLLQDQRKASSRVLDFAEIEQSLEWNGGWDRHISYEETRLCKAAALAERAWLEWEKVHVEAVSGISDDSQMGEGVWGVLKGRVVRYLLRGETILIGRSTQFHNVDINLALEGPVATISRKQAILRITQNEQAKTMEVYLSNIGKAPIYVDGKTLLSGDKTRLFSNGLIEIAQIRLQLFIAVASTNNGENSSNGNNQQTETKLAPTEQQPFKSSSSIAMPQPLTF